MNIFLRLLCVIFGLAAISLATWAHFDPMSMLPQGMDLVTNALWPGAVFLFATAAHTERARKWTFAIATIALSFFFMMLTCGMYVATEEVFYFALWCTSYLLTAMSFGNTMLDATKCINMRRIRH